MKTLALLLCSAAVLADTVLPPTALDLKDQQIRSLVITCEDGGYAAKGHSCRDYAKALATSHFYETSRTSTYGIDSRVDEVTFSRIERKK